MTSFFIQIERGGNPPRSWEATKGSDAFVELDSRTPLDIKLYSTTSTPLFVTLSIEGPLTLDFGRFDGGPVPLLASVGERQTFQAMLHPAYSDVV